MRRAFFYCILSAGVALAGCSPAGPDSHRLSGTVTLDGQPIPHGEILFTPDGANQGPQGIAEIRDGKYDTGACGGKGIAGGPTIIRVNGMSGPGGKTLCEYEMPIDLPRSSGTHNIDVPKKGATKPGGKNASDI